MPGRDQIYSNEPVGRLRTSRAKASQMLVAQIELGRELADTYYRSYDELDDAASEYEQWDSQNKKLLGEVYEGYSALRQYSAIGGSLELDSDAGLAVQAAEFKEQVADCLSILVGLVDKLPLHDEPESSSTSRKPLRNGPATNSIFIVHGSSERWKHEVARFLEKGGTKPIILHEQPNRGRTIIEKLESNSDAALALVLLTADDFGGSSVQRLSRRARQNVILELGFFLGKFGRERVCAMYEDGVEIPSDFSGVVYIPLDTAGGWKGKLAQELTSVGLSFDIRRALS